MTLTDAGPLVALFDRTNNAHGRCVETLKGIDEPIATTIPILTEAFHLHRKLLLPQMKRLFDVIAS